MASKYPVAELQAFAQKIAAAYWNIAVKIWGEKIGTMPDVRINTRLTACGGRAWHIRCEGVPTRAHEYVEYSAYLMLNNRDEYQAETIPHELAHIIEHRLYDKSGHGANFKYVMEILGCKGTTFHNMVTMSKAKKRNAK